MNNQVQRKKSTEMEKLYMSNFSTWKSRGKKCRTDKKPSKSLQGKVNL